ncbi:hypothetical protein LCGC14_0372730 [marine sediment metagenome]|uniref:Uncharacterized protein n=1 Tax=marine sediment metagenome TaxID=412755 RepID=A0A0F9TMT5_9ZZZZ
MPFNNLSKAFSGNDVSLLMTDSGLDEIVNVYNMRKRKITPRNRVDTRGGVADFWTNQLLEITFESVVTKDLYEYLDTNSDLNARTVLPLIVMQILALSQSGLVPDDVTENFSAQIYDYDALSINGSYWWIGVKMIVRNDTVVIS